MLIKEYDYLVADGYADYQVNEFTQTLKWTEKGRKFIYEKLGVSKTS